MKKLPKTTEEKIEFYKEVRRIALHEKEKNQGVMFFICLAMETVAGLDSKGFPILDSDDPALFEEHFPEFVKRKPKNREFGWSWFSETEDGDPYTFVDKRIAILDAIIKELYGVPFTIDEKIKLYTNVLKQLFQYRKIRKPFYICNAVFRELSILYTQSGTSSDVITIEKDFPELYAKKPKDIPISTSPEPWFFSNFEKDKAYDEREAVLNSIINELKDEKDRQ